MIWTVGAFLFGIGCGWALRAERCLRRCCSKGDAETAFRFLDGKRKEAARAWGKEERKARALTLEVEAWTLLRDRLREENRALQDRIAVLEVIEATRGGPKPPEEETSRGPND